MSQRRFGAFEGVFTPCILSILGVIMYLRLGWVVGQTGVLGTFLIIILANFITMTTTLSMSSIVTNIRIGTGGAYSMITKSLGVQAGGAVGLPLYISQAISVAFYIIGFSECWAFVFPHHDGLLVSLTAWTILFAVTFFSAKLAFQIQYFILALIVLSLISVFVGTGSESTIPVQWVFDDSAGNFWDAFVIFFPAVTGILAGASMSGELKDPRVSIPFGTIIAIAVSLVIYLILAYWFGALVPRETLLTDNLVVISLGKWPVLVIGGIMGATISSGLNMFVGAPRTLLALGKHAIIPFADRLTRINSRGEPVGSILFTGLIALAVILFSSLDQIASLLTMFFLITYGMINMIVFLEQSLGIVSFRPSFKVSRMVSFLGGASCIMMMFIIDVTFSVAAIAVVVIIYLLLIQKKTGVYSPDIRSGILVYLAEKFAKLASRLPYYPKIWKPNLLVPVTHPDQVSVLTSFIRSVVFPNGRVTFLQVIPDMNIDKDPAETAISHNLSDAVKPLRDEDIFVESTVAEAVDYPQGVSTATQAIKGMYFPPNTYLHLLEDETKDEDTMKILKKSIQAGMGLIVIRYHEKSGLSRQKIINVWVRQQSPNMNLSILIALQLERNWEGSVRIIQVVEKEYMREEAEAYLRKLRELMRLPGAVDIQVLVGTFRNTLEEAPAADINIFGMQEVPDLPMIRNVQTLVKTTVVFLRDSKHESALA